MIEFYTSDDDIAIQCIKYCIQNKSLMASHVKLVINDIYHQLGFLWLALEVLLHIPNLQCLMLSGNS